MKSGAALEVIFFSVVRPGGMTPVRAGVVPLCVALLLNFCTPQVTMDILTHIMKSLITTRFSRIVY